MAHRKFAPLINPGYIDSYASDNTEVNGASPWGASTVAGMGDRQPIAGELAYAEHQGKVCCSPVIRLAPRLMSSTSRTLLGPSYGEKRELGGLRELGVVG